MFNKKLTELGTGPGSLTAKYNWFPRDLHFAWIHATCLLVVTSFPSSGKKVLVNTYIQKDAIFFKLLTDTNKHEKQSS